MNEEKQRIAIAEMDGFKGCTDPNCDWRRCQHLHKEDRIYFPEPYSIPQYPDYPRNLNALHTVLVDHICGDKEREVKFLAELNSVIDSIADSEDVPVICEWSMALVVAEPWMLAKAFLKATGKWDE